MLRTRLQSTADSFTADEFREETNSAPLIILYSHGANHFGLRDGTGIVEGDGPCSTRDARKLRVNHAVKHSDRYSSLALTDCF